MKFDKAMTYLLSGKAVKRYHWGKNQYLKMESGKINVHETNTIKPLGSMTASALLASDWQLVDGEVNPKDDIMAFFSSMNAKIMH